jgi:hypothetical protein
MSKLRLRRGRTCRAIGASDAVEHAEQSGQRAPWSTGDPVMSPWSKRSLRRKIHRSKRRRQGSERVGTDREEVAAVLPLRPEVVVGLAAAAAGGHLLHLATLRRCRCCHRLPRSLLRRGRRRATAEQVVQRALPATVAHAAATDLWTIHTSPTRRRSPFARTVCLC